MRILYVAASADLASIELILGQERFNVYSTDDAEEAVELGKMYDYDLCLLGDLPQAHRVLTSLRAARCKTPILRFSRSTHPDDIVSNLNAGADDYLIHSEDFHPKELVARIHAIVRRSRGHAASVLKCGDLTVNLDTKTADIGANRIRLTGKEYQMLEVLALRQGSLVTKEMFLNHLYGGMDEPEIKIIDVFICKLRKKLGPGIVETVWGRGYMLHGAVPNVEASLAPEIHASDMSGYGGLNTQAIVEETILLRRSPSIVPGE